jgi:hypothetical protein
MLGQKTFAPKLFYQVSLEERVPAGHLLRRITGRPAGAGTGGLADARRAVGPGARAVS